ncbi:hypothetical protein [Flaviaesturariibacter terrae]
MDVKQPALCLCLALSHLTGSGQDAADTLPRSKELPEIRVTNHPTRITHFKTTGFPSYRSFRQGDAYVCLVSGYPAGRLRYVEFYFNTGLPNLLRKKLHIEYRDVELQLLLFRVDSAGAMGASLIGDVRFTVRKEHSGALRVLLDQFDINDSQLLIGFRVTGPTVEGESNIYVRMNEVKNSITYSRLTDPSMRSHWYRMAGDAFKLRLGIEQ